jgi:hypothetical protein
MGIAYSNSGKLIKQYRASVVGHRRERLDGLLPSRLHFGFLPEACTMILPIRPLRDLIDFSFETLKYRTCIHPDRSFQAGVGITCRYTKRCGSSVHVPFFLNRRSDKQHASDVDDTAHPRRCFRDGHIV